MANSNSSSSSSVAARFGVFSGDGSAPPASASPCTFALLSDDIVLNILAKLEADPRDWARLACVCARLSYLIRVVCFPSRCSHSLPADLFPSAAEVPVAAWTTLHKLSVCCPGLLHSGVLLENSDFGLERDIGPNLSLPASATSAATSSSSFQPKPDPQTTVPSECADSCWSLFDDLYFDTVYDPSESQLPSFTPQEPSSTPQDPTFPMIHQASDEASPMEICPVSSDKRKKQGADHVGSHLATGPRTLSREQGSKLLASRFRDDCLYICDRPGCVHAEEKRTYMLFRGVFKDFRRSRVWRTISDSNRDKIALDCAFCACNETWDLHSAFCLRRVFGFHDDGEPVVRAYVCENGHVSGAWTERPL